ncbi:MAG: FAD/NAD(P)-binding protein [Raineya sp.]|jgi:uncharacterized NAD(P)/FAD-binding protein YdhS|nr:FAD/NAD(P)-binding protein [Raineya sp.]
MSKKTITIIGAGFSGLMTAIHLIVSKKQDLEIVVVSPQECFTKGMAYNTYSKHHLLNVVVGKMSCFPDEPEHFLNWLSQKEPYKKLDKNLLATVFAPRELYGTYLHETWQSVLQSYNPTNLKIIYQKVTDITYLSERQQYQIEISDKQHFNTDYVVLATGNELPKNPTIINSSFFQNPEYFQNPWMKKSVENVENLESILLIGNGLTMVDVVLGLQENNFQGIIYSLSPNGFQILPHRHNGVPYLQMLPELSAPYSMSKLFSIFRKHITFVRQFGISAEPVIDSVRSISQKIWQELSLLDKQVFMRHARHLWGVARHRLPTYIYDKIQELQRNQHLQIIKGKLLNLEEHASQKIKVSYWDRKNKKENYIWVNRVINCTGPNTDISQSNNPLIQNLYQKGLIQSDDLKLGIQTNIYGAIYQQDNEVNHRFFALGSLLKGMLWESTAVPELRVQAKNLAQFMLENIDKDLSNYDS